MSVLSVCTRSDAQLGYVSVADDVNSASLSPAQLDVPQIAALVSSISRNNAYEGRDPFYIPDNLASGFVADLLGIGVQILSNALLALQRRGLIRPEGRCLRIIDRDALDELAEASDCARRYGQHLSLGQSAKSNAILKCNHDFHLGRSSAGIRGRAPMLEPSFFYHTTQTDALT